MDKRLKWLRRLTFTALGGVALWGSVGLWGLPAVVPRLVAQWGPEFVGQPVSLERVILQPFTLTLALENLRVGAATGPYFAVSHAEVDVEWETLWTGVPHLAALAVQGITGELSLLPDGTLDLLATLPKSEAEASSSGGALPPFVVDDVYLQVLSLALNDKRTASGRTWRLTEAVISGRGLDSRPDQTLALTVEGHLDDRTTFDLSTHFQPTAQTAAVRFDVRRIALDAVATLAPPLPLQPVAGDLNVSGAVAVDLASGAVNVTETRVGVRGLRLASDDKREWLSLDRCSVGPMKIALPKNTVNLGEVVLRGLKTSVAREKDGTLDWQRLISAAPGEPPAKAGATSPAKTAPTPSAKAGAAPPAWSVAWKRVSLEDIQVSARDDSVDPPVMLDIGPLSLAVDAWHYPATAPVSITLASDVGKQGHIGLEGTLQPEPVAADLRLSMRDIDVRLAQAYLPSWMPIEIKSGMVGADLAVAVKDDADIGVTGQTHIDQWHLFDTEAGQDLLRWQRLTLAGIDYRHGQSLTLGEVLLEEPRARFVINEDRSTNLSAVMEAPPASDAKPSSDAKPPLRVSVGKIRVNKGILDFADYSLTPNFVTSIQQLNGAIEGWSTDSQKTAALSFAGRVDRYAPVDISGRVMPADPLEAMDITARFNQIELATFTPYSGKFAGYRIRKGRLNLALHYRIDRGQLDASNEVLLEGLQLGDKVDSPDATSLPVSLAIALLKDSDGNIKLDVPIKGDLESPEFEVGEVIWRTVKNLVKRAVASPFTFIAGLFKDDEIREQSDRVQFDPGSSEPLTASHEQLLALAKALKARPQLQLDIEGAASEKRDGGILAQAYLDRQVRKAYVRHLQAQGEKVTFNPDNVTVPADLTLAMLESVYPVLTKQPLTSSVITMEPAAREAALRQELLDVLARSDRRLRELARDRALAIKAVLVEEGGIDSGRVYLLNTRADETEGTRLFLAGDDDAHEG